MGCAFIGSRIPIITDDDIDGGVTPEILFRWMPSQSAMSCSNLFRLEFDTSTNDCSLVAMPPFRLSRVTTTHKFPYLYSPPLPCRPFVLFSLSRKTTYLQLPNIIQ